jgi:phosphate starvation-inducible PhoH-like protein
VPKAKFAHRKERRELRRQIKTGDYAPQFNEEVQTVSKKQQGPVQAKTEAQGQLLTQIYSKDITFVTGPAGTGKTYVAAAAACDAIHAGTIDKIIVCRPMVGVGEDMGFLPGDEEEKYMPWIQPVADVFDERLGKGFHQNLMKNGRIQYKPLMMMRGSSFKDSWIILDEAQNTTPDQMKMFLTRIGENCKMIINGDALQSDLKDGRGVAQDSGLEDAVYRLRKLPAVGHVEFTMDDIVRHGLIKDILLAYG